MSSNILDEIVEKRKTDIAANGFTFGAEIPSERKRKAPVAFIKNKGTILEVKRASPSKGDIAPELNAAETAKIYARSGTSAISVLTEENYFKGSLRDLIDVCDALSDEDVAILRKDFLISPEEVEIAYRCGADAVLLIARILDKDTMLSMAKKCHELGMTSFIELKISSDLEKLSYIAENSDKELIVSGVNARDLTNFTIDMLSPVGMLSEIKKIMGEDARVVFESGIRSPSSAKFAGSLGFTGMLLGEAAARNPETARELVSAFVNSSETENSKFWTRYAKKLYARKHPSKEELTECSHQKIDITRRPFIKVCGLTDTQNALCTALSGADFLGFIFSDKSKRLADRQTVEQIRLLIPEDMEEDEPVLVGVVTDCTSGTAQKAIELVKQHKLDVLQLHGNVAVKEFFENEELKNLPHYCVVNLSSEKDFAQIEKLLSLGEPRILVDAQSKDALGGTGNQIDQELLRELSKKVRLWIAGGIGCENAADLIRQISPELLDTNSKLECEAGMKDENKLIEFDEAVTTGCRYQ